jgi:predicted transcriptional regulator
MARENDPNKRRDPKKKSQTFWLHEDVIEKLNQLSAASLYSKTDLIKYWIEEEYKRQDSKGNLTPRWKPFAND